MRLKDGSYAEIPEGLKDVADYFGIDIRSGESVERIRTQVEREYGTAKGKAAFYGSLDDSRSRKIRKKLTRKKRKKARRLGNQ